MIGHIAPPPNHKSKTALSYTGLLTACRRIMASDEAGTERPRADVNYVAAFRAALDAAMTPAEERSAADILTDLDKSPRPRAA